MTQLWFKGLEPIPPPTHYDYDPSHLEYTGAGPLIVITKDQLHPPMVDELQIWSDGRLWFKGAIRHTFEAASICRLKPNQSVLDIGCGLGGPARVLVDCFNVRVTGISNCLQHIATGKLLNLKERNWKDRIQLICGDFMKERFNQCYDCAWSMNMLYQISDHPHFLQRANQVLKDRGILMVDDWMFTPRASDADRNSFDQLFDGRLAVREEFVQQIAESGFRIREFVELGHVGRTHLATYFRGQYDLHFRDRVKELYGEHGRQIAEDFCNDIETSISMYKAEKLTWVRLVATKEN